MSIAAIVSDGESGGEIMVCSPAVGLYSSAPMVGEVLVGGSRAGRLSALGRRVNVTLPQGVTGRVAEQVLVNRRDPVEYGEMLLRLVPVETAEFGEGIISASAAASRGLAKGTYAVVSPTHGMFYRRSAPDAPAYVEVGQVVETGNTLALVEVMKCFSAITYGGEGLPGRAEVIEVRVSDGAEVESNQVLFVVKPAPAGSG